MLILVGVTINVALNGGIFGKAETATRQTEEQAILEEMLAMMDVTNEGKIDYDTIIKKMKEKRGAENVEYAYPNASITGKLGTYNYIVSETEIKIGSSKSDVPDDLATYILGADGKGRDLTQIFDVMDENSSTFLTFKQDPADSNSKIHEDVKYAYMEEGSMDVHIRYGRDIYKFTINESYNTVEKSLTKVSTPEGNLGKYVTYNGDTWIVLSDDSSGVELISANAIGSVTLGGSTFEEARTSYNNAVSTIISECGGTGSNNIRSVGGPASDTITTTVDFSELTKFKQSVDDTYFAQYEGKNGLKIGDENLTDYNKMKEIGIIVTDTPAEYWLASPFVVEDSFKVDFRVPYVNGIGESDRYYLCWVGHDASSGVDSSRSYAVRPVVTLPSGALGEVREGVGTRTNPIEL